MDLLAYVQDLDRRQQLVAATGKTGPYLLQIAKGIKQAGPKLAQAIHDHTNGTVRRSSLRPDLWGRK